MSSNPSGVYDPLTGIWTIGTLANGETTSLTINATVNSSGLYVNSATVSADTYDPNLNNNTDEAYITLVSPALNIEKSDSPDPVQAGGTLTYTIEYWNSGNADATNVVITETYDPNVTFVSATPAPDTGTNNKWTIGTLPADNTKRTITITVTVNSPLQNGTLLTNKVSIQSDEITTPVEIAESTTVNTPTPPTAINVTFNVPEAICASSFTKFVLTFTCGTSPYEYEVDFGDGTLKISGNEQGNFINLTHVYDKPGVYTVSIVVKDKTGKTATLTQSVTVKDCTPLPSVYHHNFIIGYPDNTVRPERNVSRVEVAAMILRALGISVNKISDDIVPFKDIPVTHWGYNFTRQIYLEGLMQGDERGNFNADTFATRAEIATVLVRLKGVSPDYSDPLFKDIEKGKWYTPYVNAAVKAGLITGYPDKTFRPNDNVTRAEFVTMLERVLYRTDIPQVKNLKGTENILKWKDITTSHWAYYIMLEAWQPHVVKNVILSDNIIKIKSKTIPVYLPKSNTEIEFPKIGASTSPVIVPVDGIEDGALPKPRSVVVKIVNTEQP